MYLIFNILLQHDIEYASRLTFEDFLSRLDSDKYVVGIGMIVAFGLYIPANLVIVGADHVWYSRSVGSVSPNDVVLGYLGNQRFYDCKVGKYIR